MKFQKIKLTIFILALIGFFAAWLQPAWACEPYPDYDESNRPSTKDYAEAVVLIEAIPVYQRIDKILFVVDKYWRGDGPAFFVADKLYQNIQLESYAQLEFEQLNNDYFRCYITHIVKGEPVLVLVENQNEQWFIRWVEPVDSQTMSLLLEKTDEVPIQKQLMDEDVWRIFIWVFDSVIRRGIIGLIALVGLGHLLVEVIRRGKMSKLGYGALAAEILIMCWIALPGAMSPILFWVSAIVIFSALIGYWFYFGYVQTFEKPEVDIND